MRKERTNTLFTVGTVLLIMTALIGFLFIRGSAGADDSANTVKSSNEQSIYNILLLGRDSAAGLCDVMIIVSIDTESGNTFVVQIPRDTYFDYTDESYKKINGAPSSQGIADFTNALGSALGIKIDFYLSIDYDALTQMVDALSGVEIDIPMDMSYEDPYQNLSINFKAGKQVLDGKAALEFLRYRAGYVTGDLGRIDAQKLFINAFAKRITEKKNPAIFLNIFNIVKNRAQTNIREQDIVLIGLRSAKSKGGNIYYVTAPGEAIQSSKSGAWYYILSKESMMKLLCSHLGVLKNENDFDKEEKFVDNNIKSFYDIYNKRCGYKIYSAQEIGNNEITIN